MKPTVRTLPLLAILLLLALAPRARTQVAGAPATIDYQGQVLDAAGAVLAPTTPTNFTMQFRIYNQQTGGTIVGSESQIVTVDKGAFSVRLGNGVRIPAGGGGNEGTTADLRQAFNAIDRFLGLTVTIPAQTPAEITPRLAFLSSPFSLVAERAKLADTATAATTATTATTALTATSVNQTSGSSTLNATTINNFTLAGPGKVNASNTLEFGGGVVGKEGSAGKIGYGAFNPPGYLDIVGAGTTGTNRKIHLFAEGGLLIDGPATATSFTGIGSGLTSLNASNITSGTLADARLSANIPKLNAAQTFTATPTFSSGLTVSGGQANVTTTNNVASIISSSSTIGTWLDLQNTSAGGTNWQLISTGSGNGGGTGYLQIGTGNAPGTSTGVMTVRQAGSVGIGTGATTGGKLNVASTVEDQLNLDRVNAGGALQYGWRIGIEPSTNNLIFYRRDATSGFIFTSVIATNGQYSAASDVSLKKDIAPLPSVLERVRRLQPKHYRFKDAPADSQMQTGFIAQDVEPLFPDLVTEVSKGIKGLNYAAFGTLAVAAIQELAAQKDAENKALTQRLDAAEKRLAALEAKMTKLSAAAEAGPVKTASVAGR